MGKLTTGEIAMDFIHFQTLVGRMILCTDLAGEFIILSLNVSARCFGFGKLLV
jgi:hypothetical protein